MSSSSMTCIEYIVIVISIKIYQKRRKNRRKHETTLTITNFGKRNHLVCESSGTQMLRDGVKEKSQKKAKCWKSNEWHYRFIRY